MSNSLRERRRERFMRVSNCERRETDPHHPHPPKKEKSLVAKDEDEGGEEEEEEEEEEEKVMGSRGKMTLAVNSLFNLMMRARNISLEEQQRFDFDSKQGRAGKLETQ